MTVTADLATWLTQNCTYFMLNGISRGYQGLANEIATGVSLCKRKNLCDLADFGFWCVSFLSENW